MSRLTRDGTAEPVSRDKILRHARGKGNINFPCSADHEQDWQPYPVDSYSAICDDHTYIQTDRQTDRQTPSHANGIVGCSQAPLPFCRDDDACGTKVPAVKQKRIAAKDVLLPSLLPDVGIRWSLSPTYVLPA